MQIEVSSAATSSPDAHYVPAPWLILTGYSAAAERARVTVREIKSLLFLSPADHPNSSLAKDLLDQAKQQLSHFEKPGTAVQAQAAYEIVRDGIDELISRYFGLTDHEQVSIRYLVVFVAKSLQPTSYAELNTPLQ
ncbi:hypothetical protein [Qipengyuania sp.]|uniref:hypothetical protein n=1 Tax=Qipengyuania sp. TaxID=2004515 RepID=UPI003AF9B872